MNLFVHKLIDPVPWVTFRKTFGPQDCHSKSLLPRIGPTNVVLSTFLALVTLALTSTALTSYCVPVPISPSQFSLKSLVIITATTYWVPTICLAMC